MSYLLNTITGEVCDTMRQSESGFRRYSHRTGARVPVVVYIAEKVYKMLNPDEKVDTRYDW